MKKVILIGIILIFLTGCGGLYNIGNFVLPDDLEFLALIDELNTPKKIGQYMLDNFEMEEHPGPSLDPYESYLIQKVDCDDCSIFAIFMANCNGYETYHLLVFYPAPVYLKDTWHSIAIYKEGNYYTISEFNIYKYWINFKDFKDILNYFNGWTKYKIYDYNMNIVEQGENN